MPESTNEVIETAHPRGEMVEQLVTLMMSVLKPLAAEITQSELMSALFVAQTRGIRTLIANSTPEHRASNIEALRLGCYNQLLECVDPERAAV